MSILFGEHTLLSEWIEWPPLMWVQTQVVWGRVVVLLYQSGLWLDLNMGSGAAYIASESKENQTALDSVKVKIS